ncbi:thiamine diphosphokinase [Ligilactobacillus equi]|uniref:thiamine diphosphokinase n=1 Tax=Ligilactobacillus equi TaxID=137357 RepID=UPI0004298E3D|nr:thiamine diphosphokinase [Ligilactobacillus equi]
MKQINILVGGPKENLPQDFITRIQANPKAIWIGADYGAVRLAQLGCQMAAALGDFDSSTAEEVALVSRFSQTKLQRFKPEKDYTDTELILKRAYELYPDLDEVVIYGATGGRLDHLLANIFMATRPGLADLMPKVRLIDCQNTVTFYQPGSYTITKEADKKYLGFFLLTPVKALTLRKVKYPLQVVDFAYPVSLASNEFLDQTAHFAFESGMIAVIQSKD